MRRIWGERGVSNLSIPQENGRHEGTPSTPFENHAASPNGLAAALPVSTRPLNTGRGRQKSAKNDENDAILDDDFPLPFSAAADAYRNAFVSPEATNVASFMSPVYQHMASPARSGHDRATNRDSTLSTNSVETKEDFLLELLSGQALVEVQDFEILSWEMVDQLKQEHKNVIDQIGVATHKLEVESKMRDVAVSLKRNAPSRTDPSHLSAVGLERNNSVASLDERAATATARADALSSELETLKQRELSIRLRLLRHVAAVLAATLRRRDNISNSNSKRSSVLGASVRGGHINGLAPRRSSRLISPIKVASSPGKDVSYFDGAHFFAGNRSAITPVSRFSPRTPASAGFPQIDPTLHAALQADVTERTSEIERLKEQIAQLTTELSTAATATQSAERQLASARTDLDASKSALEQTQKRSELRVQSERATLVAALARHRASSSSLASCVPALGANDDAASAFENFFQQSTAQVQSAMSSRDAQLSEISSLRSEVGRLQKRAIDSETAHAKTQSHVRDLWDTLPAAATVDVATAAPNNLSSAFSTTALPGLRRGLGIGNDDASFSPEAVVERAKALVNNARALSNRVVREHGDGNVNKLEADRLQKALSEAQETLAKQKIQMRDLEARAAAAATQEVASLERLNELQAGFEASRVERIRLEKDRDALGERARQAETERNKLAVQVEDLGRKFEESQAISRPLQTENEKLQTEAEALKQQVADAQDDLDDIKTRESKQRVALLDELNTAHSEISTLRSQLRAEQRKRSN